MLKRLLSDAVRNPKDSLARQNELLEVPCHTRMLRGTLEKVPYAGSAISAAFGRVSDSLQ